MGEDGVNVHLTGPENGGCQAKRSIGGALTASTRARVVARVRAPAERGRRDPTPRTGGSLGPAGAVPPGSGGGGLAAATLGVSGGSASTSIRGSALAAPSNIDSATAAGGAVPLDGSMRSRTRSNNACMPSRDS